MPVTVVVAGGLIALSPVLVLGAVVVDVAEGWRRRRWLRVVAFAVGYAVLELCALVLASVLWIATGFGFFLHRRWAQRAHRAVMVWWGCSLLRLIEWTMSTKVQVTGAEVVTPAPIVTIARHVSMGDAVVPVLVLGKLHGLFMRYTLKNDLVWVPAIDLYGHRLPNYFLDRKPTNRDAELEPIRDLAAGIDEHAGGVIFPEGTFRTPRRFERALARIARTDPERAERVARLRHLLPARSGGTLAMLDGAPAADVVVIAHIGFEKFHSFAEILANLPFDRDIEIGVWRIPRDEVPTDADQQAQWLDEQWQRVDDWIEERAPTPAASPEGARPPS